MNKQALTTALEVKESMKGVLESVKALVAENKALKEALAKQEQGEPVAWALYKGKHLDSFWMDKRDAYDYKFTSEHEWKPLYTTPQQRTWVGLTDDEVEAIFQLRKGIYPTIHEVEAKLKEKNT